MKKNVVMYIPDSTSGIYLPLLWASCKSYYELYGERKDEYNWVHPRINYEFDIEKLKNQLLEIKPDVFGISMYIWNDIQCLEVAKWVKETFPNCLVISGGPQQYFKHEADWFEKYSFLDASLDGAEYGELTIADILDNLREDNTVDWNNVREVVYPSKNKKTILKSKKSSPKMEFKWDFSAYDMQKEVMIEVANDVNTLFRNANATTPINGKLETTRGCPYSCTFCDWGGGTGTKVIKKSIENVKKDIDVLEATKCVYVFLCDANFGIMRDRDIDIMKYIADRKKANPMLFHLYFGGFAKSDKHTGYIKEILDLDAQNNLTWDLSYKASIQSIDRTVLDNIKRSDISFDKHIELAKHLKTMYGFSSYAECISGLPGITTEKWYHEINVYASHDMDICLYNWHLLPETPSYSKEYRQRMKMQTVNKYNNMQTSNSTLRKSEVVVETYSYTKEDYKEMWIAFSIQRGFWTTGLLEKTLKTIFKKSNLGYGDFVKKFYREFLKSDSCGPALTNYMAKVDKQFKDYYDPNSEVSNLSIQFPHCTAPLQSSVMLEFFYEFEDCREYIKNWLLKEFDYLSAKSIDREMDKFITVTNKHTSRFTKFRYINYSNPIIGQFNEPEKERPLVDYMLSQMETYTKSNFLTARVIGI